MDTLRKSWIQFVDEGVPRGQKTHIFRVEALADTVDATNEAPILGTVKWFGRWRCYAFFPGSRTVFEKSCLRDIAAFCEDVTIVYRAKVKK